MSGGGPARSARRAAPRPATVEFGSFGPNDPHGGRPMPASIGGVVVGFVERVVEESFRSDSVRARKLTVVGYKPSPHSPGLRALGADDATVDRVWDGCDGDREYASLGEAKDALRASLSPAHFAAR